MPSGFTHLFRQFCDLGTLLIVDGCRQKGQQVARRVYSCTVFVAIFLAPFPPARPLLSSGGLTGTPIKIATVGLGQRHVAALLFTITVHLRDAPAEGQSVLNSRLSRCSPGAARVAGGPSACLDGRHDRRPVPYPHRPRPHPHCSWCGNGSPRFQILYADPPWHLGGSGKGSPPYPMMAAGDICALPVGRLAAANCALLLWAVHSRKPDEVRERIVRVFGDVLWVKLFARQTAPGRQDWGKEVECDSTL